MIIINGFDLIYFIRENIIYCFNLMKSAVIFEENIFFDFPITLFDILLGLFITDIFFFLFENYFFSLRDDYDFNINYDIFEKDFDDEE